MRIKNIIEEYRVPFERKYSHVLLPGQLKALYSMIKCRTPECGEMLLECPECGRRELHPHSCGNRSCPQCQNHESTKWITRQKSKLLPVKYFLVTFTVPFELRWSAYCNQRIFFEALFTASSEAMKELAANPRHLNGDVGMTAVLHTNNRRLDIHPHIHFIVPAGAINRKKKQWKKKNGKFLLPRQPLAKLFKGKLLATLKGEDFLMLILQHVLPKGFRRIRDYGFLHGNAKKTLKLIQLILYTEVPFETEPEKPVFKCPCCGHKMLIIACAMSRNIDLKGRASPSEKAA